MFKELRYDNICVTGIITIYDKFTYRILEKRFNITQEDTIVSIKYEQLFNYVFEDNKVYHLEKYLLDKYKDDIVFLYYSDTELENLIDNKQLNTEISNYLIYHYITSNSLF